MRLKWNPIEHCFEAEFSDFQADLAAVKAAGFKTTGPPGWIWFTLKASVLDKLRANKPASGLTILTDALEEYKRIKADEEAKKALLTELKAAKKAAKQDEGCNLDFDTLSELSEPISYVKYVPPAFIGPYCHICNSPVYFYEVQEPPTCIWCEKVVDNAPDLF